MLHISDVSIFFLMIEFGGRASMCSTINTLCMPRLVLINLTTAPTVTSSIKERPSFEGDIRVRTCLYIISHNLSLFLRICYMYILHKHHIRYIVYMGTSSDFLPHICFHLRMNHSQLKVLSHNLQL